MPFSYFCRISYFLRKTLRIIEVYQILFFFKQYITSHSLSNLKCIIRTSDATPWWHKEWVLPTVAPKYTFSSLHKWCREENKWCREENKWCREENKWCREEKVYFGATVFTRSYSE